jgi:hypothetical protein
MSYDEWPTLHSAALHGLAGDVVGAIRPCTEADPVALLAQLLTYFGTVGGRSPHFPVEATDHHTNLFCCLVGNTSRARKGTSYDHIERLFLAADPTWSRDNVTGSCGSGEGLIAAVRDAVYKREATKERGKITGYRDVETDPGVADKRLLVFEAEFASLLTVAGRAGSILSETLRKAWDSGHLRNPVKTSPLRATNAHISTIGHITIEELQRTLTTTECMNGYANRYLWFLVKRSNVLPDGGRPDPKVLATLTARLQSALEHAKQVTIMHRDDEAQAAWRAVYPALTEDQSGMVGAVTARSEAMVTRLAMIYALLDSSAVITHAHVTAGLAVWQYCQASARYLFGSSLGDATADTLLATLQAALPKGVSRSHILRTVFQRNLRADELDRVIKLLAKHQLIRVEYVPRTGGYGRGTEMYYARPYDIHDIHDMSSVDYVSLSNDAVKRDGPTTDDMRGSYDISSGSAVQAALHACQEDGVVTAEMEECNACPIVTDDGGHACQEDPAPIRAVRITGDDAVSMTIEALLSEEPESDPEPPAKVVYERWEL